EYLCVDNDQRLTGRERHVALSRVEILPVVLGLTNRTDIAEPRGACPGSIDIPADMVNHAVRRIRISRWLTGELPCCPFKFRWKSSPLPIQSRRKPAQWSMICACCWSTVVSATCPFLGVAPRLDASGSG